MMTHSSCGVKKIWMNLMSIWMWNDTYEHTVCVVLKKFWYDWNENVNEKWYVWAHSLCGAKELWYEMNMWMQLYEWALNDCEWEVDNDTHYMWCK